MFKIILNKACLFPSFSETSILIIATSSLSLSICFNQTLLDILSFHYRQELVYLYSTPYHALSHQFAYWWLANTHILQLSHFGFPENNFHKSQKLQKVQSEWPIEFPSWIISHAVFPVPRYKSSAVSTQSLVVIELWYTYFFKTYHILLITTTYNYLLTQWHIYLQEMMEMKLTFHQAVVTWRQKWRSIHHHHMAPNAITAGMSTIGFYK